MNLYSPPLVLSKKIDPRACESLCAIENRHVGKKESDVLCPAHTGLVKWRVREACLPVVADNLSGLSGTIFEVLTRGTITALRIDIIMNNI